MTQQDVIKSLGEDWKKVQNLLIDSLYSDVELLRRINTGILDNSGKMLRPMMTLLVAKLCSGGKTTEESVRYAAAVEILHNATLIHDDVADDSDTRRGAPTVKALLGPTPAVLVGDFWLAKVMSLLAGSDDLRWTTKAFSGTLVDLAEGEMLQQEKAVKGDTSVEDYLRIIFCKTASLFRTACVCGARSVAAPEKYMDAAADFGRAMGMAFQIQDDILDYEGEDLGKPVGVDLLERKITLPLLGALEGSSDEGKIRRMVREIPQHPGNCELVRQFVMRNDGVARARVKLDVYVDEALAALEVFPDSKEKAILASIAGMSSKRTR